MGVIVHLSQKVRLRRLATDDPGVKSAGDDVEIQHRYISMTDANQQRRKAMGHATSSIITRIEWCRRQRMMTHKQVELERWRAEEDGLRDALLSRDQSRQYRYCPPDVFERYALGLHDGRAMLRVAWVDLHLADCPQ
jgi:hypothetical protein